MKNTHLKLSVVIVNYNTRDDLHACLAALMAEDSLLEIIVVDNASSDGSAAMVRDHFPQVKLLAQAENTWFCGGNNLGIAAAAGEYILLLNPDTVVQPDALGILIDFLDSHPDYAGATAQLRYPDGSIQRTCSRVPSYAYLLANHTPLGMIWRGWREGLQAEHWYAGWERDSSRDVEVMPGSCTLLRREKDRMATLLDGDLLLYFPEDDLARRLSGRKFRFIAEAVIIHREKASTQNWRAAQIYFRDMLIYTGKHHGRVAAGVLWLLSRPLLWGMWLRRRFS